jgi:hypothetical protein
MCFYDQFWTYWIYRNNGLGRSGNGNRLYLLINRTFPGDSTNKLSRENIREDIQEIIYDAIEQ